MEKLYNNIELNDNFAEKPSDAQNVPYLKNPPEVINITVGRQLFVDDFLIEETNLKPEYHKAKKYEGNPILKAETEIELDPAPTACPKSGGVWYDEEDKKFKMWYEAGWLHYMAYAESDDGINWTRPSLDEKKGTNLILPYEGWPFSVDVKKGLDIKYLRPDSTTFIIDYDAPKSEKYKMYLRSPGGLYPGVVATSGDGIHFENFTFSGDCGDRTTIFYNPFRKKWVDSIRKRGEEKRHRLYRERDHFLEKARWEEGEAKSWMYTDELDEPNPYIGFEPHLYNVDCVGYESIMLGMFEIMYGPENDVTHYHGVPKINELIPMYSRDGYNFSRPSRESIINASMYKGAWDRGYVQSVGGVTVINGDELWIYYSAYCGNEDYSDKKGTGDCNLCSGTYWGGATGLAKMRRDGFVSLNGDGSIVTRKLEMSGKASMHINAEGTVTAEILDAEGKVLAKSDSFSGDSTNAKLEFNDFDIKELSEKVFRIKFNVSGKLYSFGFADEKGDFGGAHAAGIVK